MSRKMISSLKAFLILIFIQQYQLNSQIASSDCFARLENGILILENSKICRTYKWNNGNIITKSLLNKENGKLWQMDSNLPDLILPGQTNKAENAVFFSKFVSETAIAPEHLEVELSYVLDKLEVRRIFRIYPNCPVIACNLYFRGESNSIWLQEGMNFADMANLEKLTSDNTGNNIPVIDKIELPGKHWQLDIVEFLDITDRINTLVFDTKTLSYTLNLYRGNILFAHDNLSDNGIFILKEAPTSTVQLAYPGGDFMTEFGTFRVIGVGLNPSDLDTTEWTRGYGFAIGVYSGEEINRLTALREYQKNLRIHRPERDEMILMNTWGDRGEDKRINEKFSINELEAGMKLGITHFQLDAGWQKGNGLNFTQRGALENIWSKNDYWEPHPERFPNGLDPVVKKGKELGIEICLWFAFCRDNSNANWEKDANILIGMYRKYGIRTFKIDFVNMPDKLAEINFRKFLEKVLKETDYNSVFNLDVTAGRRGGYHYFNEYGNLFLENRYTDWQNYYPYKTLRNLWMLSKYVPAQNLQIEFLNKWRNTDKYKGDPFGPANYSFEYLFAITMPSQPLAWFEGGGLPVEAFSIAPVIKKYKEIQVDFHNGDIFPIGEEPSGRSCCGFQSVQKDKGYFLVFREANDEQKCNLKTWLAPGTEISVIPILGKGEAFNSRVGKEGLVSFTLHEKNSYGLYRYIVE